jgi:hypothetical protein
VLGRVLPEIGGMEAVDRLAGLSGSDFASVMLEVARRRAARETPASVLRRYTSDRFVRPGGTPWRAIRLAEDALLRALPGDVDVLTLAPVAVEIVEDHERQHGGGYYRDLCFKINAYVDGIPEEIGDGGFTDWTMRLAASKKERLLISGMGLDRLAALAGLA